MITKSCNVCNIIKIHNKEFFYTELRNKSGLSGTCLDCYGMQRELRNQKIKSQPKPNISSLICTVCRVEKPATIQYFHKHSRSKTGFKNSCKECRKIESHNYNTSKNCKEIAKQRRKNDIKWRMRKNIGIAICNSLKKRGYNKEASCFQYLDYSIDDLKNHLESQFEPWMNWDNWGIANSTIKTWNIDHIIPQSRLPYDSLEHPNFKKCWSLDNLKPIDSIENIKKGNKI